MTWTWTDAADVALGASTSLGDIEAGTADAPVELVSWYRRGETGTPITEVALEIAVDAGSSRWLRTGDPAQDGQYLEARVIGIASGSPADQPDVVTDWQSMGAYRRILIPTVYPGAGFRIEFRRRIPSTATPATLRFRAQWTAGAISVPVPWQLQTGVLSNVGVDGEHAVLRGGGIQASGTPDDEVTLARRLVLVDGKLYGRAGEQVTFDDLDSAAAALTAGESYRAVVSDGPSGVVVTKSLKGSNPSQPARPAGHAEHGRVVVAHTGSAPVIEAADIESGVIRGRFEVTAGTGLEVIVSPGRALGTSTLRQRVAAVTVPLSASASWWLWQLDAGTYEVTSTSTAPTSGGAQLLASGTTDATTVSTLVDERSYAESREWIAIVARLTSGGSASAYVRAEEDFCLEFARLTVLDPLGTGTAGQYRVGVDVLAQATGSASAVFASGEEPTVAYDADPPNGTAGIPDVTTISAGDMLRCTPVEFPTGVTEADVFLTVGGWRP